MWHVKMLSMFSAENVLERTGWVQLSTMYKIRLAQCVYKVTNGLAPHEMQNMFRRKATRYNLKNKHALILLRPETKFLRNSIAHRGAILWNNLPANIKSADGTNNVNALIKK